LAYFDVVSVDIWDGANEEPVIYHGYTLTSKILVKDVLQAVRDYGFIKSPCVFFSMSFDYCNNYNFTCLIVFNIHILR